MNKEEKKMYKRIINYNGSSMALVLFLVVAAPFFLETTVFFDSTDIFSSFRMPSSMSIIFSESIAIPMLILRLIRDYLIRKSVYPKENLANADYDLCLKKIDGISKSSGRGRMGKAKFEQRNKGFAEALEFFEQRVKKLQS